MSERPVCDHIQMIKTPKEWPRFPFLPLTRPKHGDEELGVIWVREPYTVRLTNLYLRPSSEEDWRRLEACYYDSAEAMVADGWRVN